jgi:flagellar M-ring protein FliF
MAERHSESPVTQALRNISGQQKIWLIFAVGAVAALIAGLWMWGATPDYRVLYSNLSDRDGGAIIDALQQMNVPYRFADGGGALLVPANQVHEVRLRLAAQGLPKAGAAGFELMENQKFGTSQFLEQVNYQRALEGELARSVQTLDSIQSARVHLAIPKASVFVKEQQQPRASVVLTLYHGRSLTDDQVNAIVHLISGSVPDMPAKNVTVVDQNGALLSATPENNQLPLDATQIAYVHQIEQDYGRRIEGIVAPLVGDGNVHAQVTADIDFTQTEQASETYQPNQPPDKAAVRSEQTEISTNGGTANPGGVPGALSNQPPVPATAPIVLPASAVTSTTAAGGSSMHKESTVNYEVDHTISYSKLPVGSVRRLSVAVVVNHRIVTDKNGKATSRALSDEEKGQIIQLVKDAIGFNEKRGDTLSVLNSAFDSPKEVLQETPWWKQPENQQSIKDLLKNGLIGAIALFLLLGVIRPALRRAFTGVAAHTVAGAEAGPTGQGGAAGASAGTQAGINGDNAAHANNVAAAKQLAQQDPKVVASVVKEWINGNE